MISAEAIGTAVGQIVIILSGAWYTSHTHAKDVERAVAALGDDIKGLDRRFAEMEREVKEIALVQGRHEGRIDFLYMALGGETMGKPNASERRRFRREHPNAEVDEKL